MSAKARLVREIKTLRERILSMRITRAVEVEMLGSNTTATCLGHNSDAMINELSHMLKVKQRELLELITKSLVRNSPK